MTRLSYELTPSEPFVVKQYRKGGHFDQPTDPYLCL